MPDPRQVADRPAPLDDHAAALDAFARFTEASSHTTDPLVLAAQARDVLRSILVHVHLAYYEPEDGYWKARVLIEDMDPAFVESATAGFAQDLPSFRRPFEEGHVVFVEGWDAEHEGVDNTDMYTAGAFYPYTRHGVPTGLLVVALTERRGWRERERTIIRAVGRSLELALERGERARQLERQNAELDARTRALEAFAALTRDLTLHTRPDQLIRRALEMVRPLLPPGYAAFWQLWGATWHAAAQVGDVGSPALQAVIDAGLPAGQTPSLDLPRQTGEPLFQDVYDRGRDVAPELAAHLHSVATLPVRAGGEVAGIFNVALFGQRGWGVADRALLETTVHSLGQTLERVTTLRRLEVTQHHLRLVAEHAPIVLFVLDAQGTFTLSEGRGLAALGMEPGEAVGHSAFERYAPFPAVTGAVRRALSGEEVRVTLRMAGRAFETWYVPLGDGAGGVAGVALDVTEREEAEAALRHANEELRRSNAELEQFAYVASHDLQAPIRAVMSFAEIIDRRYGPQLDSRGHLYLRQILDSGDHMKRLVDDLLAFSRLHTGQRELLPVDSEAVFDAVVRRLQPEAVTPAPRITRGDLPLVLADVRQLDQLLQNLISNGLKYHRAGVVPGVHVSAKRSGNFWRFAVSDNGIGIEPQYFDRIFMIFQRLHGREEYEGTGIGLAVCKKIVERHGGRLWLESTPGEGSTFFFTLPEG